MRISQQCARRHCPDNTGFLIQPYCRACLLMINCITAPMSKLPIGISHSTPPCCNNGNWAKRYHPNNECLKDENYRQNWMAEYRNSITATHRIPKATFVLITTVLYHDKVWDETLDEIRDEMNDKRILRFRFREWRWHTRTSTDN